MKNDKFYTIAVFIVLIVCVLIGAFFTLIFVNCTMYEIDMRTWSLYNEEVDVGFGRIVFMATAALAFAAWTIGAIWFAVSIITDRFEVVE